MSVAKVVAIDFEFFEVRADFDFVYIHDGYSGSNPLIGRLSGWYSVPPGGFMTSQIYMYIKFTTEGTIVYRGFKAIYRSISIG